MLYWTTRCTCTVYCIHTGIKVTHDSKQQHSDDKLIPLSIVVVLTVDSWRVRLPSASVHMTVQQSFVIFNISLTKNQSLELHHRRWWFNTSKVRCSTITSQQREQWRSAYLTSLLITGHNSCFHMSRHWSPIVARFTSRCWLD